MSNKPLKKSDSTKTWRKTRTAKTRARAPEYHLIVTEGTRTEPNYFEGLKQEINIKYPGHISIKIEGMGQGANTLLLLERALQIVKFSGIDYKHIWLVYDKDDFSDEAFDKTMSKCENMSSEDVTYHALWSNECVEYWFLLHFSYLTSALHRSEYIPKLTEFLGTKYEKNRADIYTILRSYLPTAIKNAKRVMASYNDTAPSKCTPGTRVYEIFDMLSPYLD